jgi:iron complex transport system ATP-binding protein
MIRLKAVEVIRNKKNILGPISLQIKENDFIGVIGPNGAGKSTLLNVLLGLEPVSRGQIELWGQKFAAPGRAFRNTVKKKLGVLFQNHQYLPDIPFTAEDIIFFGRSGSSPTGFAYGQYDHDAVEQAIATLELQGLRKRLYRDLSGGEQQKVQLARLLAQKSTVLLLDEPSAGLDLDWQERLTKIVADIFLRARKTIIMVTHDIDRLPACCKKLLLLKNGTVLASGQPLATSRPEVLSELYGCHMEVVIRKGRIHAFSQGVKKAP